MRQYLRFLGVSYLAALFFEIIANTIGDGKAFENPGWPVFFLIWYGLLYSLLYLFRRKPIRSGVVFFAVLGSVLEIIVFRRSNLIVDPIIYGLMAFIPLRYGKAPISPAAK